MSRREDLARLLHPRGTMTGNDPSIADLPWEFGQELAAGVQSASAAPQRGEAARLGPTVQTLRPDRPDTQLDTGHDPAAVPSPIGPGAVVDGRYRVERRIGRGGAAEVYRVVDLAHGELRALKLLVPRVGQRVAEARFEQEIRLCQAMDHPNLVKLYDAGIWEGRLYYAMEFLQGMDLRDYLGLAPGRGIAVRAAVEIAIGISSGLDAMHRAGIIHRDIKPANLQLVPGEERVKLVDFGIATASSLPLDLTEPDMIVGTPAYVSPERVTSPAPATPQADLYSLGVILYEMLTGRRPFAADNVALLFDAIVKEHPRPARLWVPHLPWELEALLDSLMARKPSHRPESAEEVLHKLIGIYERL